MSRNNHQKPAACSRSLDPSGFSCLVERDAFLARLRQAKSWREVFDALAERGCSIIPIQGDFVALNVESGARFNLSDCGHSLDVFVERLGSWPPGLD